MAKYGLLIDESICTGCRGCQVACKQWNDLPAVETKNTGSYTNPPSLNADTWLIIDFKEVEVDGELKWSFLNRRCMHCEHPACVSACPVGALKKHDDGPVLWNEDKCIGCRYCMVACPFDVPTFTWDEGLFGGGTRDPQMHPLHRPDQQRPGAGLRQDLPFRRPPLRRAR